MWFTYRILWIGIRFCSSPCGYRGQHLIFGYCSFYKAYCFSTFIAELTYHDHKQHGEEFVLLPLRYHSSNPGLELKAGSWGQEITEAVGGEIWLPNFFRLPSCNTDLQLKSGTVQSEMNFLSQSSIEKMPYRLSNRSIPWKHFLN